MKILEINKFNYLKGGADRHFLDLVQLLKAKGNEVAVFAMDSPRNEFSPWKKYFVSYVGYQTMDTLWQKIKGVGRMFYSWEAKRKINRLLDDFQPEIVHIHNIYHQISPSILPAIKKRGIPIVMTVHDYKLISPNYLSAEKPRSYWKFIRNKEFKNSYLKSLLVVLETKLHTWFGIYARNIDLYISPSQFTKNKLVQGGISEDKIVVLPHFFNADHSGAVCDLSQQEKYVLHFGRLSKEKGVEKLCEIFQRIPEINLHLAGSVENDLQIPQAKNIKHLGFLNPKELNHCIKNSLFVISASQLPETFGLITLETLANGRPFVGFGDGSFAEIVEDGKNGYLCTDANEMKEKIKNLASNEGLRILFSRNALKRAQDFDNAKYYAKIEGLLQKLLKRRQA